MTNPNDTSDFWDQVFSFGKVLAPWLSAGWIFHQAINKIFKYFSDSRDAELTALIDRKVQPKLDDLATKIDHLSEVIWELKNKK